MSDAYNVRFGAGRYYVYRIDGNVQVAEFFTGAEAQRDAAVRNMRHNEQMGKKKQAEADLASETGPEESTKGFVEQQLTPEQGIGKGYHQAEQPPSQLPTPPSKTSKSKTKAPDPPPGQGVSY